MDGRASDQRQATRSQDPAPARETPSPDSARLGRLGRALDGARPVQRTRHAAASLETGVVQRARYAITRRTPPGSDTDNKLKAAALQNLELKAIHTLYVPRVMRPAQAHVAVDPVNSEAIHYEQHPKRPYPKDTILEDRFPADFRGDFFKYKVQLISHPDAEPDWAKADAAAIAKAVKTRVSSPYPIVGVTKVGGGGKGKGKGKGKGGGAIGRTVGGKQAWSLNPDFGANPTLGERHFQNPQQLYLWAVQEIGLPKEDFIDLHAVPDGLEALPAPAAQPLLFYVHKDTPRINQESSDRSVISHRDYDARFRDAMASGTGFAQQGRISAQPRVGRKQSRRDPNTMMGTSAHSVVGGKAPPMKGTHATHEWCHLVGDADGGACAPENLLIGTQSVNTEQLAMEKALRPQRARAAYGFGLGIWIDASALASPVEHDRGSYLTAEQISYTISLVNLRTPGRMLPVYRHVMDGQRGAISGHEFRMVGGIVAEHIGIALDMLMRHPAELAKLGVTDEPPKFDDIDESELRSAGLITDMDEELGPEDEPEDESEGSVKGMDLESRN